jgi:AraC-like DNA-binding protein
LVDWLSHDSATGPFSRVLSESAALGLRGLLDRLGGNPQDGTLEAGHESAGLAWLLREAWAAFAQARDSPQGTHLHPAVERACRWLCEHAADPLADDLEHLAKRAGCSRPWLSRLFKQQLGMSLTEFRQRQRLRLFIERIGRGNRFSLTEAAYAAGFGCYSQCFRAFRQSMGCSPAEYLRRVRGQTGDEGG